MKLSSRMRRCALWSSVAPFAAAAFGLAASGKSAKADAADQLELKERCATRLSIALLGKSPAQTLIAAPDPQAQVETMLQSTDFVERFARFTNANFNQAPGMTSEQDSAYHLSKKIITEAKPWSDMFVGQYSVVTQDNAVVVIADPNGLGYFRSPAWLKRYAGNELQGVKITTAYRIMQNVLGLKLQATTNAPTVDTTATGRQAAECSGCHYDNWYALDKVASVLTRRKGDGDDMTFTPPVAGAQPLLGGLTIADDKQLVQALVNSDAYRFNACRLAFKFLYGRPENKCEAPAFDKCVAEFSAKTTIQSAIAAVAKDVSFCQ